MKRLNGVVALVCGALLVVVPRFVLPACEYRGFPRMHCSDTAHAEMAVGAALLLVGAATLMARRPWVIAAAGILALALSAAAILLPEQVGYCHSPRMPCTYGMVPAVRFIAGANAAIVLLGLAGIARRARRKAAT